MAGRCRAFEGKSRWKEYLTPENIIIFFFIHRRGLGPEGRLAVTVVVMRLVPFITCAAGHLLLSL